MESEEAKPQPFVETGRAVAHPWLCDDMGHMNSRYFAAAFDDASYHLMTHYGQRPVDKAAKLGWADVRHVDEFRAEVKSGSLLLIKSRILRLGRTSMTIEHEMSILGTGTICASREATAVCFDLENRQAHPLPNSLRSALT